MLLVSIINKPIENDIRKSQKWVDMKKCIYKMFVFDFFWLYLVELVKGHFFTNNCMTRDEFVGSILSSYIL